MKAVRLANSTFGDISVRVEFQDFNGADVAVAKQFSKQWAQIRRTLRALPLHLKASDQKGKIGNSIFDPVGTNSWIKDRLTQNSGWSSNPAIPAELSFLGTDVDFVNRGLLVEVQFSNYPFLLNNVVRTELFYQSKMVLDREPVSTAVIITKGHMFPASNSTLYYEQAAKQLDALTLHKVLDSPVRLVGLLADCPGQCPAVWTEYDAARYSRTVVRNETRVCKITPGSKPHSRCKLQLIR